MMCECGCGNEAMHGNCFLKGHNLKKKLNKIDFKVRGVKLPIKLRKYKLGDTVYGFKDSDRKYHGKIGTLVDAYVTLNRNYGVWRNPAYVVLYPNGERRTWQWIRHVFVNGGR